MYIKFWGTRGSIPSPGGDTLKYGGNTSCVEIQADDSLIIIDCGTGIRPLGIDLLKRKPEIEEGHILISHTHWDHIQGIPFFSPFLCTDSKWHIYGPENMRSSIKDALKGQMEIDYFPISLRELKANIDFHDISEGSFNINNIKITSAFLNHTSLTCGFKIEAEGLVLVYSCDHEPYGKLNGSGEFELTDLDMKHAEFIKDADIVIHDSQYTNEEYKKHEGWGHSTHKYAIEICKIANVKQLFLTHHDPSRTDKDLDKIIEKIQLELTKENCKLEVLGAMENQSIKLPENK